MSRKGLHKKVQLAKLGKYPLLYETPCTSAQYMVANLFAKRLACTRSEIEISRTSNRLLLSLRVEYKVLGYNL